MAKMEANWAVEDTDFLLPSHSWSLSSSRCTTIVVWVPSSRGFGLFRDSLIHGRWLSSLYDNSIMILSRGGSWHLWAIFAGPRRAIE